MSETTQACADANPCFVCGPDNPIGLRIRFRVDGDRCHGEFTAGPHHVGFDGVTHGGIIFSVLDDAMANWCYLQGARGFTAKAEIRYKAPMPTGRAVSVECELLKRRGRLVNLRAWISDLADATVYAETEASFMLEDASRLPL